MDAKRRNLSPVPPLPAHDELDLPIRIKEDPEPSDDAPSVEPAPKAVVRRRRSRSVDESTAKTESASVEAAPKTTRRRRRARSVDESPVKADPESIKAAVSSTVLRRRLAKYTCDHPGK